MIAFRRTVRIALRQEREKLPNFPDSSGVLNMIASTKSSSASPSTKLSLTAPIFIVGLPRTGSKLLMNIINNNTLADYHVANEVQFFGHSFLGRILQGRRGIMAIVDSEKDKSGRIHWERAVDRLYSGEA